MSPRNLFHDPISVLLSTNSEDNLGLSILEEDRLKIMDWNIPKTTKI